MGTSPIGERGRGDTLDSMTVDEKLDHVRERLDHMATAQDGLVQAVGQIIAHLQVKPAAPFAVPDAVAEANN